MNAADLLIGALIGVGAVAGVVLLDLLITTIGNRNAPERRAPKSRSQRGSQAERLR